MSRITLAIVLALALPGAAWAQSTTDAAKADGKAFGKDMGGAAQAAATTQPNADRVPGFSTSPGQSTYFDDPTSMERQAASQASSNTGYQTMRSSMDRRAKFNQVDLDAAIARSKAISQDPLSYTSGMGVSGTQGRCVPLPPSSGSAARYKATCNTGYTVESRTESCAIPLTVSFTESAVYRYYAEIPAHTGIAPPLSEFSGAISSGICTDLGPTDACAATRAYGFQTSNNCSTFRTDIVECRQQVDGLSGLVVPSTGARWFAQSVSRTATTSRDESLCASLAADNTCTGPTDTCTDSDPTTRIIDGVAVTQPCWAWRRDYQCNRFSPAQDCDTLASTPGCKLEQNYCITELTPCRTYERVYDCPVPDQPQDKNQFICDGDVYCVDGSCETIARTPNDEFKDAVVGLSAMDQARREFDPDTLTLFKGTRETCSSQVFGLINCCKGKGFPLIPGIQLLVMLACSREEMLLHQKDAQGLCAYVGTYCASSFLGICLTKRKVYCCFESKLSRILQEQGRAQLNKPWGKPKTEQCLGFTIDEFAQLDLSKMDFSEVYAEFTDAARLPDELQAATQIQQKIEEYYARARP